MMIGIGTPSRYRRIERMSASSQFGKFNAIAARGAAAPSKFAHAAAYRRQEARGEGAPQQGNKEPQCDVNGRPAGRFSGGARRAVLGIRLLLQARPGGRDASAGICR